MADYVVSQLTLLDGRTVEIKDAVARAASQGGTYFLGVTTTALTDGATTNPIVIGGTSVTAVNGNQVVYENKEFVFASFDSKWHELGDLTGLGDLALKDSASGVYTPTGSISLSELEVTATGVYTPAGTISKPDVDVTPVTSTIKEIDTAGSVTAGVAASATLPVWNATVTGEVLTFSWNQGAFTPNTPTAVILPTSKNTSVMTGVSAELHNAPAFSGTQATIEVDGSVEGTATFVGTQATITVT